MRKRLQVQYVTGARRPTNRTRVPGNSHRAISRSRVVVSVLSGLIAFCSLSLFAPDQTRFVDEADNLLGALIMVSGDRLYTDYFTHHMPGMYFLSAPAAFLAIDAPLSYRLYFYAILALVFALLALRSAPIIGNAGVLVLPLFYAFGLAANSTGASFAVLAEHLSALGTIALLLEIIRAAKLKTVSEWSWLLVGAVAVLSLWFSFTGIYTTAALVGTLLILTISFNRRKATSISWRRPVAFSITSLVTTTLVLVVLQWWQSGVGPAFKSAFLFNTQVYSPYIGDFSKTPLTPVYKALFNVSQFFAPSQGNWPPSSSREVVALTLLGVNVAFLYWLWRRNRLASVGVALATLMTLTRGTRDIHAIPYWGISTAMAAVLVGVLLHTSTTRSRLEPLWRVTSALAIGMLLAVPYIESRLIPVLTGKVTWSSSLAERDRSIARLVPETERYFDTTSDLWGYVRSGRLPATRTAIVFPWSMERNENQVLEDLERVRPEIIIHNPDFEVWGYAISDYAPLLNDFISSNYLPIGEVLAADGSIDLIWLLKPS